MALLSRFALLSAIPVLLSGNASSQSLPKAPKTEVITVTPKPGFFTEPSIGVNPANPLQVVAAFQDNAHIAYSVDGIGDMSVVLKSGDNLQRDRKSTRLNSSHGYISYAVFCLKKKKTCHPSPSRRSYPSHRYPTPCRNPTAAPSRLVAPPSTPGAAHPTHACHTLIAARASFR